MQFQLSELTDSSPDTATPHPRNSNAVELLSLPEAASVGLITTCRNSNAASMAGDKGKEGRDQSDRARPSTDHSYSGNLESLNDGFDPPPEIDWEKPPVYELVGSGDNVSTTIVAQGEFRQLFYT